MNYAQHRLFILSWLVILAGSLSAHSRANIKLESVVFKQLFEVKATSIYQVTFGYIWLGSKDGLYRFDGHETLRVPDARISSFKIDSIVEGEIGTIWIGGTRGVFKVNSFTLKSSKIYLGCENELSCNVQALAFQGDSLWIGTNRGLFRHTEIEATSIEAYEPATAADAAAIEQVPMFKKSHINSLLIASNGVLILGTNSGLFLYSESTKEFSRIDLGQAGDAIDKGVYALTIGENNTLYAGGKSILYEFDDRYTVVTSYQHKRLKSRIWSLAIDDLDQKWIGSVSDGLFRLRSDSSSIESVELMDKTGQDISVQRVSRSIVDKIGNFWATTDTGVFFQLPKEKQNLVYIPNFNLNTQAYIHTIFKQDNILYYSNLGEGLSAIDINSGYTLPTDGINSALKDHNISTIISDNNKNLWMGTYRGVAVHSLERNTLVYDEPSTSEGKAILRLYPDSRKNMWSAGYGKLGYYENGDYNEYKSLNPKTKIFYTSLIEYSGTIIVGASDGLYIYSPTENIVKKLHFFDHKELEELWVTHLQIIDSKLFVNTRNGLRVIKLKDFSAKNYKTELGSALFNNHEIVASYTIDDNIFAFTKLGLIKFNTKKKQYSKLNSFEYNIGSYFDGDISGQKDIFVANEKGISIISVNDRSTETEPRKIELSNFTVDENSLSLTKTGNLEKSTRTSNFNVSHQHQKISLSFSNFEFRPDGHTQVEYRLDKKANWIKNGESHSLSLQTLSPGPHEIAVRSTGSISAPFLVLVNVSIPWWHSTFLRVVFALLVVLSIILLTNLRSRLRHAKVIQRNNELESAIAIRTKEIDENSKLIEKQASHLEHLIRVKDELFINLTHELKTPLSLIMCPLNLIKDKVDDTQSLELIELAELNGTRLLRDLNHLLDIDSSVYNATHKFETHNFKELTLFYVACFRDLLNEKNITLNFHCPFEVFIRCSPQLIEKIVVNLMSNLIKYTPEGATGNISIESDSEYGILKVSNEGSYIPEDMRSTIFERFTRLEQHDSIFGTGIGLALVKQLTESLGGQVQVESSVESGTCFSVYIPLSFMTNKVDLEMPSNSSANNEVNTLRFVVPQIDDENSTSDSKPSVLIVEDNKELAQCLTIGIQKHYKVITENDGTAGLNSALKNIPDLVITDIRMPKKDGFEICKELKNNSKTMHIPIIVLTANASVQNRATAWQLLADEFIEKPFDWRILEERIANLLKTRDKIKRKLALDYVIDEHIETSKNQLPPQIENKMERIKKVISENYHLYDFGPEELASAIGMSKRNLTRQAKELIGTTPMEYIKSYRLKQSKILLAKGYPVTRVSEEVGIKTQTQFSRAFKDRYGLSPRDFQKHESEKVKPRLSSIDS